MLYRKQQIQAKKVLNQQENTEIAIWEGGGGAGGEGGVKHEVFQQLWKMF